MDARKLIEILGVAERLKDATRHCTTSGRRHESVAEHCWRAAMMAYFMKDEFPEADMDKVIRMLLLHDMGEAFTGDIPVFDKTDADEVWEEALLMRWVASLPEPYASELRALYAEMDARESIEARIYKAIDGMEAVLQHNESPLDTWVEREYSLNLNHAMDRVGFSPYLTDLRRQLREDTLRKIETEERVRDEKGAPADALAKRFGMEPHVEGGSFVELDEALPEGAPRAASGVIYYHLGAEERSQFHVLDSDEYWLWHAGTPLEIWVIDEAGELHIERLGIDALSKPCVLLKAGTIFGARHIPGIRDDGTLVSCVTVPRFSYASYRILSRAEMLEKYPETASFYD